MDNLTKRIEKLEQLAEPPEPVNFVFRIIDPDGTVSAEMVHDPQTGKLKKKNVFDISTLDLQI